MPTLTNNFETGLASGTAVSAANSASGSAGNAWDNVTVSGSNTWVYSTAHPAHGTLGALVTVAASAGQPAYGEWSTSLITGSSSSPIFARLGIYATAFPASGEFAIIRGLQSTNQRWRVALLAAGTIAMYGSGATAAATSTALSLNTHYRIEVAASASATLGSTSIEVRIYVGDSTTPAQTLGPLAGTVAMGGPIDRVRYVVGASASPSSTSTLYVEDAGASTVTWLGPAVAAAAVDWTWIGAVSSTGASVSAAVRNIASARLVVSLNSGLTSPVYSSAVIPASGAAKLAVTGLSANTVYYYGIEADGVVLSAPTGRGSFKTFPTAGTQTSFSVAFGSCQQTNSNTTTFAAIAAKTGPYGKARVFLHEGDLHYRDFGAGTTATDVDTQYQSSLAAANLQTLVTSMPTSYVWDNHDWGGSFSNASAPAGSILAAAYRRWVPHYTLPTAGSTSIYQAFTLGRVRFIVLDTRSGRSAYNDVESSTKNMLSTEQETWLGTELARSEPVKVLVCGIYWRSDASGGDRWGSYRTQFERINATIASSGARCYVVFGDRHALAADDGSTAATLGMPQASGAPFHQGSTPETETWSHGYYDGGGGSLQAYGWLDITDSGASITVAYSGITSLDDTVRVSMSTSFPAAADLPATVGIHL